MSLPPHEIYAEQLILLGCYGYPLWQANPFGDPPVDIADVGFIKRGSWVKMFNATKLPDDPSNRYGLPEGHYPIRVGRLLRGSLPALQPIYSRKVECLRLEAGIGETKLPVDAGLAFKCSKAKGAALVLKEDTLGREVLEVKRFVSYMCQNYKQWLAFAETCGYAITLKDMIFVTGYERTSAWASAAFSENSITCEAKFAFGKANLSLWGSWETHHPVFTNYGTSSKLNIGAGGGNESMFLQADSTDLLTDLDHRDQCVFLKGFRICDRKTAQLHLFSRRAFNGFTEVYPKDKNAPYGNKEAGNDGNAPHGGSGSSSQPSGSNLGGTFSRQHSISQSTQDLKYDITQGLTEPELFDDDQLLFDNTQFSPWDILFLYIFENSEAELAIIHDDDFAMFSAKMISNISQLYNELNQTRPQVFTSDSLGVLDANLLTKEIILNDQPVSGIRTPSHAFYAPPQEAAATIKASGIIDSSSIQIPGTDRPSSLEPLGGGFSAPPSPNLELYPSHPYHPPPQLSSPSYAINPSMSPAVSGSDMSRASSCALSMNSSQGSLHRYNAPIGHPRRRRSIIDKDDMSDNDHGTQDTTWSKFQLARKQASRRQRIEAEQRRRDELRDGYARLKDVLPVTNQKSSKVSLLERAANHIRTMEERIKTLNTRLAALETQGDFPASAILTTKPSSRSESDEGF